MRKIKFQAWDKINKKWIGKSSLEYLCVNQDVVVLVKYAPNKKGGYDPISCNQLTNPEVDNLEVNQFTGLTDKNEKEIYEGDIVRDTNDNSIGNVSWNNIWMKWDIGAEGKWAEDSSYCSTYIEVIGNIYQNPELLNSPTK